MLPGSTARSCKGSTEVRLCIVAFTREKSRKPASGGSGNTVSLGTYWKTVATTGSEKMFSSSKTREKLSWSGPSTCGMMAQLRET